MAKFVKLQEEAIIPQRATFQSAGYDLHALEGGTVQANDRLLIKTGISWVTDENAGIVGLIKPRSGLAYKHGIAVMAGVIDADYRKDIGVILHNTSVEDFVFEAGDKIAQLVVQQFFTLDNDEATMEKVIRDGGFGSTGK